MNARFAAVLVAILASACATVEKPAGNIGWPERRAQLQSLDDWSLKGRIAVAAGTEGFSGGMNWRQQGSRAEIALRGPLGGSALHIRVDAAQYEVTDERGTQLDGDEARRFIEERLGSDSPLPIHELRYWLVGAPAPGTPFSETMTESGRLAVLEQSGWSVRFDRFRAVGDMALPERLELTTGGLRLRVAISDWQLAP